MTSHTPGPWAARRTHNLSVDTWYVIVDAEGRGPIVDVGGKDEDGQIAEAKYLVTDPTTIAANAHLIATAPELAAVLIEYERIEAEIIFDDELWDDLTLPQHYYDRLIELQHKRNAALERAGYSFEMRAKAAKTEAGET